eukprot:scaffold1411_cov396-Prasinococcus_capsulatus_cf.AAC.23
MPWWMSTRVRRRQLQQCCQFSSPIRTESLATSTAARVSGRPSKPWARKPFTMLDASEAASTSEFEKRV